MQKKLKQAALSSLKSIRVFSLVHNSRWRRQRLLILAYHGVSLSDEHLFCGSQFISADFLRERLQLLRKSQSVVLPFDEAIARVKQAYRFDPLALESRNEALWIYYFSGRFRETVEQSRRTIDLEPAAGLPYAMLALAHAGLGERAEAVRAAEVAARLAENSPTILVTTASALARAGQHVEARKLLGRGLALAKERFACRFNVAAADVDLGDTEQAFESLEQAYLQRST